jgi:hypothetical protein
MVECLLPKQKVAGSIPVYRSSAMAGKQASNAGSLPAHASQRQAGIPVSRSKIKRSGKRNACRIFLINI